MKLGIIIGIENYINYPNKNLAASKNDVLLLEKVVGKSKEFDDLLAIKDGSITAKELKNELETYFNKYQGQEIEELFFYFSGHGLYLENEFYYICSDYDENKKRTTTLENSELDTYIKSIQPKLTVKVVDACNSGVNYVKDINSSLKELENTIDKSIGNFGKCYFMFSSESNQKSYADNNISFFTKSFLKCIIENINSKIRYKDIVDYISDEFELNNKQTPYFITQGNHTEVFIQANNDIVKGINLVEFETSSEESVADDSIVKIVIEDAKKYCSQKEVSEIFTKIVTTIVKVS